MTPRDNKSKSTFPTGAIADSIGLFSRPDSSMLLLLYRDVDDVVRRTSVQGCCVNVQGHTR
ncbi:hypothetical protein I7I50_03541 [Histoplasma capsulatum G186AR]|uniref:Uncharacterized protein n=1 Tax=Ajellomyces capsulatus TaxID=5037 RepID=A0A8H7YIV8_AJECA|nr:hypothetical protein I7I52_04448 [Histoplasma capsulatum]QSS74664.1 hypothetical protein I7I50_03541 [Histoplasma capsulatum G186AR]